MPSTLPADWRSQVVVISRISYPFRVFLGLRRQAWLAMLGVLLASPTHRPCRHVGGHHQAPTVPELGRRSPLCTSRKLLRFFFNQIKWTVSDSEDTGHRDTKPIGGLFPKIDRSANDSEAGHWTVFDESSPIRHVPTATGWARITKPDTTRQR
ncbi:conserved hypothetical protein [Cupriavidus necator]|uniref:Uncharacterized protein n=1 Tax=Cupriavidus necator TaxID=106590 RepID=A0A1K0JDP7_CUPNE|nr:conserved hypothetical protein [Cupriavidus necator]